MRNIKILKKAILKITALSCGILFLILFITNGQERDSKTKKYIGKIKISLLVNGRSMTDFGTVVYVFGNYTLARVREVKDYYHINIPMSGRQKQSYHVPLLGGQQQEKILKSGSETVLKGYILSDWETEKWFLFDTSLTNLNIKNTYLIKDKPDYLGPLNIKAKPGVKGFVFWKDSLVNNRMVKSLTRKGEKLLKNGNKVKGRQIIYIDTSLKDFPVHTIAEYWDKKYNGYSFRRDYSADNGMTVSLSFKFIPGLKNEKVQQIKKWIHYAKNVYSD